MNNCLIFGADGASLDLIKLWVKEGKLPSFEKIIKRGIFGNLETTIPPLTPCAWSSFMTGENPGKHCIYDFFYLDTNHDMRLNSSKTRRSKDIWEYLSQNGFKNLVFNVPFTYPPKKINGIMVTDFTTPSIEVNFTHPLNLKDEILREYPDFRVSENCKYSERKEDIRKFAMEIMDLADMQFKISTDLMKKDNFDFSMVVFMLIDHAQHWYWKYMDKSHPEHTEDNEFEEVILRAYQKVDHFLGEFMKMFPEHNIIIMSDHGGGPYYKDVSLNKWLMDEGYLFLKTKRSPFKKAMNKIGINRIISFGLNIGLWGLVNKIPRFKNHVRDRLMPTFQDIDWSRTLAYSYGYYGPIYLNRSRINSKEDEKKLKEEITKKLMDLRDPYTDKPIIKNIWGKDELYEGDSIQALPDIILNMGDFSYGSSSNFLFSSNSIFSEPKTFKSGDHTVYGVFMAYGPDIKEGVEINGAKMYDIAPTILQMFGIPVPADMDGRVLSEIFKNKSPAGKRIAEYEPNEGKNKNIKEKIEMLKEKRKI